MNPKRIVIFLAGVAALAGAAWLAVHQVSHPRGPLLLSESGAGWARLEAPYSVHHRDVEARSVRFRRDFVLERVPKNAELRIRAYRSAVVHLNGEPITRERGGFDTTGRLRVGANRLDVVVENDRGPPALLVHAAMLDIATPRDWQAAETDGRFVPATALSERKPFPASRELPSAGANLAGRLHFVVAFFLLGALATRLPDRFARSGVVRWMLVAAWVLLCANNIRQIPLNIGFDVLSHYNYIAFILENGRLPLASDGWVMFQPPLLYLIAAVPTALAAGRLEPEATVMLLRLLPMLCGLAMIEIAYRSARIVFPRRNDLQIICTVVGGFLPMNLYISQTFGNEPLSGALTALLILLVFKWLVDPPRKSLVRESARMGLVFGLALLAKVSAIVLFPAILLAIASIAYLRGMELRRVVRPIGAFMAASTLAAGWYYVRNWLEFGRPFVGGWEGGRGFDWWQDPGYRIAADLLGFGESLRYPIFSSLLGFWDGLYSTFWLDGLRNLVKSASASPQWNHEFMLSLALLSIPLVLAGLAGAVRAIRIPTSGAERVGLFSLLCIASFLVAMLVVFFTVPTYTSVKSSYALGLIPCFAVLMTSGIAWLPQGRTARVIVSGYVSAWFAFVYIAFFAW